MADGDGGLPPGTGEHGEEGHGEDEDLVHVGGDAEFGDEELFSDDDSEDLDADQMIRDIGHHGLMDRVQARLFKRISDQHDRVAAELREKAEELKRLKQDRETVGVDLYNVQQQLAKLQMQLESAHGAFQQTAEDRTVEDERLAELRERYEARTQQVAEERRKLDKNQVELDALNATLLQVERYNEEMRGEIAVIRRATYKAEEGAQGQEKAKKRQDLYIDGLNERLRRLHEQLALYEAQIQSQKRESEAAEATLREAAEEMEGISFEKQQLVQQWQSALVGMQRRDEALQATQEAIRAQQEAEMALDAEIAGFKKSIAEEQERNEKLTGTVSALEGEAQRVGDEIKRVTARRERLAERYELLRKSLDQTDGEHRRGEVELKQLRDRGAVLDGHWQQVERRRRGLEEKILETQSTSTTVGKAVKNLGKEARALQERIADKEADQEGMRNELSRIRVDLLNTEAHNGQLQESLDTLAQELKEKERLIEKYELEIRQRNDEIEKKMHTVDKLNRRYEALTAGKEDLNTGPLEATIKNLNKQIQTRQREAHELQQQWLREQTELVGVTQRSAAENDRVHALDSERTVLRQKQLRVDGRIGSVEGEAAELRRAVEAMHQDMTRLNSLIARNRQAQARLEDSNFSLEQDFAEELRELEGQSRALERQVADAQARKDAMLEEVVEAERQIMLWEKKTLLERETQAALDPEVGQAEARAMEKEIHRMRLRFDTLQRDQERLIAEMERAIEKSEAIETRARGRKALQDSRGRAGEDLTRATVRKKTATLKGTLKKTKEEAAAYEAAAKEKEAELGGVALELEKESGAYSRTEDEANALQRAINDALYEKQRCMDSVAKQRREGQRFDELARRGPAAPPRPADTMRVEEELAQAESEREAVRAVIQGLSQQFDKLSEVLDRVHLLTNI